MENREIKFRAWDNKCQFMLDSSYGNWVSFDGVLYEESDRKFDTPNTEISRSKDLVLMQFLNVVDKNNKDVYEDDILSNGIDYVRVWVSDGSILMGGLNKEWDKYLNSLELLKYTVIGNF